MKRHMSSLGFPRCYNEQEDFYAFAEGGATGPGEFDALITNPPYSGKHVERLFRFCARTPEQPFFLLLPHYFYTEPYFKETLGAPTAMGSLFFVCPGISRRYRYLPPAWNESATGEGSAAAGIAPFPSFWYCSAGKHTKALVKRWRALHEDQSEGDGRAAKFHSRVFIARTTGDLPRELKSEFDLERKRPNPRARKKMAKKRQAMDEAVGGAGMPRPPPSKRAALWRQRAQAQRKQAQGAHS